MIWRLKSRSLWLKEGDRNTSYFHKKERVRLWRNNVKEINTANGETLNTFDKIKEANFLHFKELYNEKEGVEQRLQLQC
jgi:hypothetical protein